MCEHKNLQSGVGLSRGHRRVLPQSSFFCGGFIFFAVVFEFRMQIYALREARLYSVLKSLFLELGFEFVIFACVICLGVAFIQAPSHYKHPHNVIQTRPLAFI